MSQMDAHSQVAQLIQQANQAQKTLEAYDQAAVDELVTAAAWALVNPENNQKLSQLAVAETGLGKVSDKITKNHRKTLGLLRDMKGAKTVGVIKRDTQMGMSPTLSGSPSPRPPGGGVVSPPSPHPGIVNP